MKLKINGNEQIVLDVMTANDLAQKQKNYKEILVCRINNKVCDLSTPLVPNDTIDFLTFADEDAQYVFWHSSAHILGSAILKLYPTAKLVSSGQQDGFFYDVKLEETFNQEDYAALEKQMNRIISEKLEFKKFYKNKNELIEFYRENEFKTYYVKNKGDEQCCCYQIGDFVDFCSGPHVMATDRIKEVKILKNSASYFLGDSNNESLTRIKCISFPKKQMMGEYLTFLKKAEEMDHRKIGAEMDLFFSHHYSPGSIFFLEEGTIIYNNLVALLREEYRERGFKEVMTPILYNLELWKESGHYENYKENMFILDEFGMKPMNCPGHCLIFKHNERVYKELPLRLADFGVLHRNELKGTLSGLTRVRKFQQDDAHIFCTPEQVGDEICGALDFLEKIYKVLGFEFELNLSTRPKKFMGEIEVWEKAEADLIKALGNRKYNTNPEDGAFYGPKIDVMVLDALKRKHQCATIQLDFQLPLRFNLKYKKNDCSFATPVIIHRAIFGSFERMIAILLEHYGKKLPFWLSPRQIAICSVSLINNEYADEVLKKLKKFHCRVFYDESTLNKKIRNCVLQGFCVILVVGNKETENKNVCLREDNKNVEISLQNLIAKLNVMVDERSTDHALSFK